MTHLYYVNSIMSFCTSSLCKFVGADGCPPRFLIGTNSFRTYAKHLISRNNALRCGLSTVSQRGALGKGL